VNAAKGPGSPGKPPREPKSGFWYRPLSKRATIVLACIAGAIVLAALIATPLLGFSFF
jgi:hypothetical protein